MCQFLSGFGTKTGDIICNPIIDSHSELEYYYHIHDNYIQHSFKWEYTPKADKTIFDVTEYEFKIDENREPDWLTPELKSTIEKKAHQKLLSIFHKDEKDLRLLNEVAILDNCEVGTIKNTVIKAMRNSTISKMRENSIVSQMWGDSIVSQMWENSSVSEMWENSIISKVRENSSVKFQTENNLKNGKKLTK